MSTKTTLKRIALVAVSALGFGVLTAVAPASAALAVSSVSAGTSSPARVGVASNTTITVAHTPANDSVAVAAKVTSAPATSTLLTDTHTATKGITLSSTTYIGGTNSYAVGGASATLSETDNTATSTSFTLSFRADVAGTYTILVSAGNSTYTPGDKTTVLTITTVGAPTTMTVVKYGGSVTTLTNYGGQLGALYKVNFKDANGNPTVLAANESVDITDTDDTVSIKKYSALEADPAASFPALTFADLKSFGSAAGTNIATNTSTGNYYFRLIGNSSTEDGTDVVTLTGSGLLPATFTTNISVSTVTVADIPNAATVACSTDSTSCYVSGGFAYVNGASSLLVSKTNASDSAWGSTTVDKSFPYELMNSAGLAYSNYFTIAAATTAVSKTNIATPAVTESATTASPASWSSSWSRSPPTSAATPPACCSGSTRWPR